MRVSQAPLSSTLAFLLGASLTQAQYLINELSFGYTGSISPNNDGHVPNFVLQGQPNQPEILSNKVILTPVAPGNQRGSIWSTQKVMHSNFIADIDFRANGPERAGGNLNIWLTNGGSADVGMSSAYTAPRFDGLVLVIDGHGGTGGMVRGFLNDRSTDYKAQSDISALAFGHCQYHYRNLGRPSQIKLRQTDRVFKVEIDGRLCFETDKFADLHNRLQSVNHQIGTVFRSVNQHGQQAENRHEETSQILDSLRQELRKLEKINDLEGRINGLEREIRAMRTDLNLQMKNTEHSLKGYMSDHHATLSSNIVKAAPGHGKLIVVIVGSQVVLVVGYLLYKRRKNSMPKKYL
ncbi:protein EMP47 [Colletotrichum liriopes]|uniref:Protein EMP47 n=1 Tax=Colletotrichum liriopes TaxID=708192 RepID=A0AA37H1G8_9PEZI|nr:protein EMP47 [Colletotrichum liriopes]